MSEFIFHHGWDLKLSNLKMKKKAAYLFSIIILAADVNATPKVGNSQIHRPAWNAAWLLKPIISNSSFLYSHYMYKCWHLDRLFRLNRTNKEDIHKKML